MGTATSAALCGPDPTAERGVRTIRRYRLLVTRRILWRTTHAGILISICGGGATIAMAAGQRWDRPVDSGGYRTAAIIVTGAGLALIVAAFAVRYAAFRNRSLTDVLADARAQLHGANPVTVNVLAALLATSTGTTGLDGELVRMYRSVGWAGDRHDLRMCLDAANASLAAQASSKHDALLANAAYRNLPFDVIERVVVESLRLAPAYTAMRGTVTREYNDQLVPDSQRRTVPRTTSASIQQLAKAGAEALRVAAELDATATLSTAQIVDAAVTLAA